MVALRWTHSVDEQTVRIRVENPYSADECTAIRHVNAAAFGRQDEADLVDRLRAEGHALVSLVAVRGETIAGHIMFSRMWLRTPSEPMAAVALAPVAVLPKHQCKGIGGLLIQRGLELLRGRGEAVVIVVGNASYYRRFGFSPEKATLLESRFPKEALMAIELRAGALEGIEGSVVYPPPFGI